MKPLTHTNAIVGEGSHCVESKNKTYRLDSDGREKRAPVEPLGTVAPLRLFRRKLTNHADASYATSHHHL